MTQEKRRNLLLGLFAMATGVGFGWPLAEDVPRGRSRNRRSRGGGKRARRRVLEYFALVPNAGIAVAGLVVGANSLLKVLKKD